MHYCGFTEQQFSNPQHLKHSPQAEKLPNTGAFNTGAYNAGRVAHNFLCTVHINENDIASKTFANCITFV